MDECSPPITTVERIHALDIKLTEMAGDIESHETGCAEHRKNLDQELARINHRIGILTWMMFALVVILAASGYERVVELFTL